MARLLEAIVTSHRSHLGQRLVGIYLHGSRATGDHGPSSDVDYLVVVREPLTLDDKRRLVAQLRKLSGRAPAHGIEMSVITLATLRRFRHPSPFEFHFSSDWLERHDRGEADLGTPRTDPDLASHVVQTRERGRLLYGDAIESVFPPIDRRHHVEGTLNDARSILGNPGKNPLYTVLNLCRALAVIEGGMVPSKLEAAEWALEALPPELHPLVVEARRQYQAGSGEGLDEEDLASFVGYVEAALTRADGPVGEQEPGGGDSAHGDWLGLGLTYGTIRLTAARPEWGELAERLAEAIRERLGRSTVTVEHVGSSAVPGLAAKPIIDLAVGLRRPVPLGSLRTSLEQVGYQFRGDAGDHGGLVFVLEDRPRHRVAHVHVVDHGGGQWRRYLAFRDLLLTNADARERYEHAKQELAGRFPNDHRAYTAAKQGPVGGLLEQHGAH